MSPSDRPAASERLLKEGMALVTAQFATAQAFASLRQAIRNSRTADIAQWAALATKAVMEAASLVAVPGESAGAFATIRDSVIDGLGAVAKAVEADDTDGVLSHGELVGDAVVKFAVFLKGFPS